VTQLLELFRQEAGSAIVLAAREVNAGQYPSSLYRLPLIMPPQPQQQQQQQPWRPPTQVQSQPVMGTAAPRSVVAASAGVSTPADTWLADMLTFWKGQLQQRLLVAGPSVGSATGSSSSSSSSLSSGGGSNVAGGPGLLPSDALLLEVPAGCGPLAVAHVVAAVVEGLLPALGFDSTEDVQVNMSQASCRIARSAVGVGCCRLPAQVPST
jgi:hypothetical protein